MSHLLETLTGSLVTGVFNFSEAYLPTTTAILLNGQVLLHPSGNVWTESDPSTGEVTIDPSCLDTGDVVAGFALKADSPLEETIVSGALVGLLRDTDALTGLLADGDYLNVTIEDSHSLVGKITDDDTITGVLEDDTLAGMTKEC